MPSDTGEEAVNVVEVFNDLASKDRVERPSEIEVLGVGQIDIEPLRLKMCDDSSITVDPDEIRHFLT